MRRGDIVSVAPPGDYAKPRPAVVIQADALTQAGLDSVILCLMTSTIVNAPLFRLHIEPNEENNLQKPSDIMVDKLLTVPRARIGSTIGHLNLSQLTQLDRLLAFVVGIG